MSINRASDYFLECAEISKEVEKHFSNVWHEHFLKNILEKNEYKLISLIYVANDFL